MQLFALGINHHTAPLAVREKVAFDPSRMGQALHELRFSRRSFAISPPRPASRGHSEVQRFIRLASRVGEAIKRRRVLVPEQRRSSAQVVDGLSPLGCFLLMGNQRFLPVKEFLLVVAAIRKMQCA